MEEKRDKNGFKTITNISILLTEDCNFRCEYCFIDQNPSSISWETLKDTLNWLSRQNIHGEKLSVNFFGGEPLVKYDLIEKAVLYAEQELDDKFSFGVTTNGSLFNKERLDFFEKHNMSALFSIDGKKEIHNKHRKYKDGTGTFDDVEKNMKECVKRGLSPVGRPTYTPKTLPHLYETVRYLLDDVGFNSVSPTPAVDGYIEFTEEDYEEYQRQFDKINKYFKDKVLMEENVGLGYYNKCYRQFFSDTKMQAPCGAGKKYVAVNHRGDIFPCHRFVQWQEWKLGDVYEGIKFHQRRSLFHDFKNDETSDACKACENKFCGGGCYAVNYSTTGDIHKSNKTACRLSKLQWDNAISVYEELKTSKKFHKKYEGYIKRASKEWQREIGYLKDNQPEKTKNVTSKEKKKEIKQLKDRIANLETAVSSLTNIVLENIEGDDKYNG